MRRQRGYVLLVLLLFVALLSISFLAAVQRLDTEIRRDREEEMIHRAVQYSRAVRKFVKKFGRYPDSLEELENTNDIRFLRKRYKDPVTGKDFRLLHFNDVRSLQQQPGPNAATNVTQRPGPGLVNVSAPSQNQVDTAPASQNVQPNEPVVAASSEGDPPTAEQQLAAAAAESAQQDAQALASNPKLALGVPIVGVASSSKERTIRVFNKKEHYNEWQFIYDPMSDFGAMNGPTQPPLRRVQQLQQDQQQGDANTANISQAGQPPVQP